MAVGASTSTRRVGRPRRGPTWTSRPLRARAGDAPLRATSAARPASPARRIRAHKKNKKKKPARVAGVRSDAEKPSGSWGAPRAGVRPLRAFDAVADPRIGPQTATGWRRGGCGRLRGRGCAALAAERRFGANPGRHPSARASIRPATRPCAQVVSESASAPSTATSPTPGAREAARACRSSSAWLQRRRQRPPRSHQVSSTTSRPALRARKRCASRPPTSAVVQEVALTLLYESCAAAAGARSRPRRGPDAGGGGGGPRRTADADRPRPRRDEPGKPQLALPV